MDEPRDAYFVSERLRLHYVEWGDPAAPPLLLVHGGRDHARSWDAVARALAPRWRVIAPDLRGHGDSDWKTGGGYGYSDFIPDLAALIDLVAIGPIPVIAHSLGGNIALRYAALFPGRLSRLLAIEGLTPVPRGTDDVADRLRGWLARIHAIAGREQRSYSDVAAAAEQMKVMNPRLPDRLAHQLAAHGTRAGPDGRVRFKFDPMLAALSPIDITYAQKQLLWARIACPLLLVYGRQSRASSPAEDGRAAVFRDVRVEVLDQAGHWVHHDRYDAFMALVEGFLAELGVSG